MEIQTIVVGAYSENCYILWKDEYHALVIDPGANPEKIISEIEKRHGVVDDIFLTHGHFDHIGAVDKLVEVYKCPVYMNPLDYDLLKDPQKNESHYLKVVCNTEPIFVPEGEQVISGLEVEVIDTPGHSPGSCMLRYKKYLFAGDMVFKGSIGRTDLLMSSPSQMKQSIKKVQQLDPGLIVFPGHGNPTLLKDEFQYNEFLRFK